mgnify:FL=1|nr:MAG TPA: hypothetical protein [Caudoviricetes sp.]
MKDALTIEMVDNGYIVRGEGFSQVIDVTQDKAESLVHRLGKYLYDLIYQSMGDLGSYKVKIEINITNANV